VKGILFKNDMIKAIEEGRKTQTRRLAGLGEINKEPDRWEVSKWEGEYTRTFKGAFQFIRNPLLANQNGLLAVMPRYQVGETVYVKEAWYTEKEFDSLSPSELSPAACCIWYKLTENLIGIAGRQRSPMFMMEWMACHFLKITGVEPQRLQEITPEDCYAEGIEDLGNGVGRFNHSYSMATGLYAELWNSINPKHPFASNLYVWDYEFKKVDRGV
jgi:hypothetical protein